MRVVVVGTGTEIGKTHVCACLLSFARARGLGAAAYKPVASGVVDRCEDAELHALALGAPYQAPTFAYRQPISPHLAARDEGPPIDLHRIELVVAERARGKELFVVETAGGLFSPLSDAATNADLVRLLQPAAVVLVAPDRLGVLHDLRACVLAAKASGVAIDALVLSAPANADGSTGRNAAELARVGLPRPVAAFPWAAYDAAESREAAALLWGALGAATSALLRE